MATPQPVPAGDADPTTPVGADALPGTGESLGPAVRAARVARSLSVRELARRIQVSPSFISQIELGKAKPSVGTLYALVAELGVSLNELLGGPADAPVALEPQAWPRIEQPVVRAGERGRVQMSGVAWERLTVDDPFVDFLHVEYLPGSASCPPEDMVRHGGREYGVITSGRLEVQVGFDTWSLGPGDSIHFDSSTPHRLSNPHDEPCTGVWFVVARRDDPRVGAPERPSTSAHLPQLL
jgi:transcriptional regulator with XRE-family HTH domain